jgi:hypothetical protein
MAPQFDRPLRDLLRDPGCMLVRQGKDSHEIWHSHYEAEFCGAGRHREPLHRKCHLAAGWVAESF